MLGTNFVDKCLQSEILTDPWAHTVTENHIDQYEFNNLRQQCEKLLHIEMSDMPTFKGQTENQIQPKHFKEFGIDWYDQILEISHSIYDNRKRLNDHFPAHRWYDDLCISAYIGVQPPKPLQQVESKSVLAASFDSVRKLVVAVRTGLLQVKKTAAS